MTGGEDQPQQVVIDVVSDSAIEVGGAVVPAGLQRPPDLRVLALTFGVAPEVVNCPAFGDGHQPGARVARNSVARPLLERGDDGVLSQLLGEADVTVGEPREPGD